MRCKNCDNLREHLRLQAREADNRERLLRRDIDALRAKPRKARRPGKLLFRGKAMVHTDGVRLLATAGYSTPRSAPAEPWRQIEIRETGAKP